MLVRKALQGGSAQEREEEAARLCYGLVIRREAA